MIVNQTVLNIISTDHKLSKKNNSILQELVIKSTDYWTVPSELQEHLRNEKVHNAFSAYTSGTNQRELTSKRLTTQEIGQMDAWVNDEYEKCKHRITSAADMMIEEITSRV